jgi:serine/threonine protein kinase
MREDSTTDKKSPVEIDRVNGADDSERTISTDSHGALELKAGQTVADRYTVLEEIGRGGMGVVYKVNHFALSRLLALKTIDATDINDAIWRRFQQEAKATSLLDHPNLITVHDFGLLEERHPFFVMDLVEGKTLAKRIETGGPLTVEEALPLMIQVCFGLAYAHDLGIVHRDIKPSNIMLCKTEIGTANSTVKIVDFGIAKLHLNEAAETQGLTRTGEIFGSPLYMSPEQCLGLPVDHRSDIYAVGCVFFETLTGIPPFQGNSALATMMKHQSETPPTLKEVTLGKEFPEEIEKLVARLLNKDPDQRYQSLKAVARDLSLLQQGVEAQSYTGVAEHGEIGSKTRMVTLSAAILAVIAASILTGTATWFVKDSVDRESLREQLSKKGASMPMAMPIPAISVENEDERAITSLETKDGVLCRKFVFPKGFGEYAIPRIPESKKPAAGTVYIPVDQPVKLIVKDYATVTSPKFFLRFQSDDITELDISNNLGVTDTTFEFLHHLKSLSYLYATGLDISNAVLAQFDRMPQLKRLYIGSTAIRQNGLVQLKYLKQYTELGLNKLGPMDKLLKKLRGSENLQALILDEDDVTDEDLKEIGTLTNLSTLHINKCPKVTNQGLKYLLPLKELRWFQIAGTSINPGAISDLKKFPNLQDLYVFPETWPEKAAARLKAEIPKLQLKVDTIDWQRTTGKRKSVELPMEDFQKHFKANPIGKP